MGWSDRLVAVKMAKVSSPSRTFISRSWGEKRQSSPLATEVSKRMVTMRSDAWDEAAATCHLSPAYFSSYFKRSTGLGFVDWLNRLRVNKAINLLEGTELKVTHIALEVGFNNTATFNQCFRKFTGRTPSDYRRDR